MNRHIGGKKQKQNEIRAIFCHSEKGTGAENGRSKNHYQPGGYDG